LFCDLFRDKNNHFFIIAKQQVKYEDFGDMY